MANPAFGTPATGTVVSTGFTVSVTVPSGSQLLLVVVAQDVTSGSDGDETVTFNGSESLTLLDTQASERTVSIWYRVNPTATTADVVGANFSNNETCVVCCPVTGDVNTTTPLANSQKASGTTSPASLSITSVSGDLVVSACAWNINGNLASHTSSDTELTTRLGFNDSIRLSVGYESASGTSTAVGWTWADGDGYGYGHIAFAIQGVGGTSATPRFMYQYRRRR